MGTSQDISKNFIGYSFIVTVTNVTCSSGGVATSTSYGSTAKLTGHFIFNDLSTLTDGSLVSVTLDKLDLGNTSGGTAQISGTFAGKIYDRSGSACTH